MNLRILNKFYRWKCSRCKTSKSIRLNSWFSRSHLSLQDILELTFLWSEELPIKIVSKWMGISKKTVIDWYNFCRDVCAEYLNSRNEKIGGPGKVVQIDEAKFGKRKYNRGRLIEGRWVLGGIERGTGRMFLKIVPSRDAATLLPIIIANVKRGTTIHTDEWRSYARLQRRGFVHLTVNHSVNFVDPLTGAYTQTIESAWSRAKAKYRRIHSTSKELFPSYLIEYIWRSEHGRTTPFATFINCILATY